MDIDNMADTPYNRTGDGYQCIIGECNQEPRTRCIRDFKGHMSADHAEYCKKTRFFYHFDMKVANESGVDEQPLTIGVATTTAHAQPLNENASVRLAGDVEHFTSPHGITYRKNSSGTFRWQCTAEGCTPRILFGLETDVLTHIRTAHKCPTSGCTHIAVPDAMKKHLSTQHPRSPGYSRPFTAIRDIHLPQQGRLKFLCKYEDCVGRGNNSYTRSAFRNAYDRDHHEDGHTSMPSYKCSNCGRRFQHRRVLAKHMRSLYGFSDEAIDDAVVRDFSLGPDDDLEMINARYERQCFGCDKWFLHMANHITHLQDDHELDEELAKSLVEMAQQAAINGELFGTPKSSNGPGTGASANSTTSASMMGLR